MKRLELAKKPGLELLPNDGVGCGAELAGVAIRVGFTLFLVRVATVVLTLRFVGRNRIPPAFLLSRSKGRITGVNVLPGLVKEILPRLLVGFTPTSFSVVKAKSSSTSLKLDVGWMIAELGVSIGEAEITSTSPDWISGT